LNRRLAVVVATSLCTVFLTLLAACDNSPEQTQTEATQQRLIGTWLREYEEDGNKIRRLLVLQADGRFAETARVQDASGATSLHAHEGGWIFDGTNLKRKYTLMDGKQPSAPTVPFATFEIHFESNREFTGIDHVHKRELRYQRVDAGTLP
jgi:hypothetical protein